MALNYVHVAYSGIIYLVICSHTAADSQDCQITPLTRNILNKMLTGKTALVTGASRGIGLAIAKAYAAEGAKVVCAARNLEGVEKELGDKGIYISTDMADKAKVDELCDKVLALGGVDIIVNNAGIYKIGNAESGDPDEWDTMFQVNVCYCYYYYCYCCLYTTHEKQP